MFKSLIDRSIDLWAREERSDTSSAADDQYIPPEAQIIKLLGEHDGKLWQRDIVAATGWSESKVSRTLSTMEEDKRIERYQVGRENVVTILTEEPPVGAQ